MTGVYLDYLPIIELDREWPLNLIAGRIDDLWIAPLFPVNEQTSTLDRYPAGSVVDDRNAPEFRWRFLTRFEQYQRNQPDLHSRSIPDELIDRHAGRNDCTVDRHNERKQITSAAARRASGRGRGYRVFGLSH